MVRGREDKKEMRMEMDKEGERVGKRRRCGCGRGFDVAAQGRRGRLPEQEGDAGAKAGGGGVVHTPQELCDGLEPLGNLSHIHVALGMPAASARTC